MKKVLLFLWVCVLPVGLFAQQGNNNQQKTLVFTHVTVIDATGAPAKPDMTVVIRDDRIEEMGKTGIIAVPQEARVVDATGKFLIPGLWDMHIHSHYGPGTEKYLALFIANGITGTRLAGGFSYHHRWREQILAGKLIGPRMIIPGHIPRARGNIEEIRQVVREIKSDGADLIKIGWQDIPHDVYFAMADEANKLGLPFFGHLPYTVGLAEASDAGLQSLEHTVFVVFATSSEEEIEIRTRRSGQRRKEGANISREEEQYLKLKHASGIPYSEKKAAEIFARLVKNGTWVCPTILARTEGIPNDPRLNYMPLSVRQQALNKRRMTRRNKGLRDYQKKLFEKNSAIIGAMNDAGVGLLAGTDTWMPGLDLQDELEVLVQAGLSPMEALQTATYNAAKCLGLLDTMGTVERGKVADLVLLDADPLEDIGNTRKIAAGVLGGEFFDKPVFQNIFAQVRALEALHEAASNGDIEQVESLISEGADVDAQNSIWWTPLQYAASKGHKEIVELLLAHDADVNYHEKRRRVQTAAEYAMKNNHTEIVQLLISKGADISPLHFALYMKDEARARSLIEGGADVHKRTPYGMTTLRRAVNAGFKDIVELLIAKDIDVNAEIPWAWHWTALHSAAENGYKEIAELLINAGANINERDGNGRTPLWYAEQAGYTEIAEMLRKHGAKE
ncbi:MAG: ankyrin repeat domain-containing protein [Planctomycetota bacterium]|jgi:ankyrin repeat protein